MMQRLATQEDLDYLLNHPKIYPSTGFPEGERLTSSGFFDNEDNVAYVCMYGGMIFNYLGDGVYSGHFLFIPGTRGTDILTAAKGMLQDMFTKHSASVIKGYPPRENRAVRVIGTALGYQKIKGKDFVDELGRNCETYEVKEKWLL